MKAQRNLYMFNSIVFSSIEDPIQSKEIKHQTVNFPA
jgi:hypothetical protein